MIFLLLSACNVLSPPPVAPPPDPCATGAAAYLTDGSGYTTIQEAVDAAVEGDTVTVCPGTWTGAVSLLDAPRTLSLWGTDAATTTLSGGGVERILDVPEGMDLSVAFLTLQDGVDTDTGLCGEDHVGGGAILAIGADLEVGSVVFSGNSSATCGGAVLMHGMTGAGDRLDMGDVTFSGNTAPTGGGMALVEIDAKVEGVTFEGNVGSWSGGALYAGSEARPTTLLLEGSFFEGNSATAGGAVELGADVDVTFNEDAFTSNRAADGGAVDSYSTGTVLVENCTFTDNVADGNGGAFYVESGAPTFSGTTFTRNRASDGGALAIDGWTRSGVTLSDDVFSDNEVTGNGGALYLGGRETNTLSVHGSTFTRNLAANGGAIQVDGWKNASLEIMDSTFRDNVAVREGGAIAAGSWAPISIMATDTDFTENTAGLYAAALYLSGWEPVNATVDGGSVTGNTAPYAAGAWVDDEATLTVTSSDWGEGATDNLHDDVTVSDRDYSTTSESYGTDATFTCAKGSCRW